MKNKFILILLFIVCSFIIIGNVSSKVTAESFIYQDEQGKYESKGIEIDKLTLTFKDEGVVYLKDPSGKIYVYKDIKNADENTNALIKFDDYGYIEELDVTANKNTAFYINGKVIQLNKGFRAVFKEGKLKMIPPPGSSRISKTPKILASYVVGPTKITYAIPKGAKLTLPNGEVLEGGKITYSLEEGYESFYISKGDYAIINKFNINAHDSNVFLNKNIRFKENEIIAIGDGFDINFNADASTSFQTGNLPISLSKSKNNKYFTIGDSGENVKEIQKIIGLNPTGDYDKVTFEAVKKWQKDHGLINDGKFGKNSVSKAYGKYVFNLPEKGYLARGDRGENVKELQRFLLSKGYNLGAYGPQKDGIDGILGSRTSMALQEWQRSNKLKPSGRFGKKSFEVAGGSSNIIVSMQGGGAAIKNSKNGLGIALKGKSGLKIGDKTYSFDGKKVNKRLFPSMQSESIQIPTTINFMTEQEQVLLKLKPNEKIINENTLAKVAANIGIDPSSAVCASLVTASCGLVTEGEGETISEIARDQGMWGPAWQMKHNMELKGGKSIYSKNDYLTKEQEQKINLLKKEISQEYLKKKKEYSSLSKKEREAKMKVLRKTLSNKMREKGYGEIFNNNEDLYSQVIPLKGDVVSLYFRDSSYLSEALINGKDDQKNTHLGVITGHKSEVIKIKEGDILKQVKQKLGVNEKNLYVNDYQYQTKEGNVESLILKGGVFYREDGNPLTITETNEIIVNRPQLAHMIHYSGEKNPYHIENLDEVLSRKDMSLYAVTRPKSTEYIDTKFSYPDKTYNKVGTLNCNTANCNGLTQEEILRINKVPQSEEFAKAIVSSTKKRQEEFRIPDEQLNSFMAVSNAIISRESNFGNSGWFQAKKSESSFLDLLNLKGSGGYMQIAKATAEDLAKEFNEEAPTLTQLMQKEVGIKYGQRYLAKAFKVYAPEGKPISSNQAKLIGAAYNSGLYTPRTAAIQSQLQELGYISKGTKITGTYGPATKNALIKFAKKNNLNFDIKSLHVKDTNFEKTVIYQKIKEQYKEKTGKEPKYAIIPDITTEDVRGERTVKDYATFISKNYEYFCIPNC